MSKIEYELAEIICASWALHGSPAYMPTYANIVDTALYDIKPLLPKKFGDELTFGTTSTGFRCYELDIILMRAQESCLGYFVSPEFKMFAVNLRPSFAQSLLYEHLGKLDDCIEFGSKFVEWIRIYHLQHKERIKTASEYDDCL